MIEITFLGELEDGGCVPCGESGSSSIVTRKQIFGIWFEKDKPTAVPIKDVGKFFATGLFKEGK